jgi:two-component system chemotaxis response regulator CheY
MRRDRQGRARMEYLPVLLVDDEPLALTLGTRLLNSVGFTTVDTADNGHAALKLLQANAYKLVISDWNMPEMNGLELLYRMRKHEHLKGMPFLMTSVDGAAERVRLARRVGVDAFLLKPFDALSLRAKILEVLGCIPELNRKPRLWPVPLPASSSTDESATA